MGAMCGSAVRRRGWQGREGEDTRRLRSPVAMASGASPFRFLAEKKSNKGERLEEEREENRGRNGDGRRLSC